jgi:hypothetical protein
MKWGLRAMEGTPAAVHRSTISFEVGTSPFEEHLGSMYYYPIEEVDRSNTRHMIQ